MKKIPFLLRVGFVFAFASAASAASAAPLNPEISVIGDVRWTTTDVDGETDSVLDLAETEIAFVGPVNPYASAEVFVGIHGTEEVEIEEAKLILERSLPLGLGLTAGRMLLDFGQLNVVHSHAYPFVDRPMMHAMLFGDDGVADVSARLDWIAPIDAVTLRATAGVLRGDAFLPGHHHEHEHEEEEAEEEEELEPELGVSGRLELFAEPSDDVSLLIGGSVLHGEHDPDHGAKATWGTVDTKLRWDLGPDRILVANGEAVFGSLEETEEAIAADPWGWFGSVDLRVNRRWNVGAFGETTTERTEDDIQSKRFGGFVGLALMEETTVFRLLARTTDPDEGESVNEVIVQALFGLGPHRPHRF